MFLTLEQVQENLQITRRVFDRLVDTGQLRAIKVGREWRVKSEWVNDYVDRQLEEQTGQTERIRHAHVA